MTTKSEEARAKRIAARAKRKAEGKAAHRGGFSNDRRNTADVKDTIISVPAFILRDRGNVPLDQVQQVSVLWAASLLDFSERTIRRMVDRGELKATGSGVGMKITVKSIRDYINK